jgi:hypothetical protein
MSTHRVFLEYTITLTDEAEVKRLQDLDATATSVNAPQYLQSPAEAAATFSAKIWDPAGRLTGVNPLLVQVGGVFTPPAITSAWFTSDQNFPLDQTGIKRKSGGWFGISWLFGDSTYYYWKRLFAYAPADGESGAGDGSGDGTDPIAPPPPPTPISNRRWIDGAEIYAGIGENAVSISALVIPSRDASRHVDGLGWAFREAGVGATISHSLAAVFAGAAALDATQHWDRWYVRLRKLPTAAADLWRNSTTNVLQGMYMQVGTSGELIVGSSDSVAARTLHSTAGVLALNTWYRIDLLLRTASFAGLSGYAGGSRFSVYVNGVLKFDLVGPPGLSPVNIAASQIGRAAGAANGLEFDIDDWVGAEFPTKTGGVFGVEGGVVTDPSWFAGSRCRLIRPSSIITPGLWSEPVEGWRRQLVTIPDVIPPAVMLQSSTTALDTITYGTDADKSVDALAGQVGVGAFILALYNLASGASNGRIGYKLASGAAVLLAHDNSITNYNWSNAIYNSGVANPPSLAGLQFLLEHSNSAQTETHGSFLGEAEILGYWGNEDPRALGSTTAPTAPIVLEARNGIHNAPYPTTPWATSRVMAPAPVVITGGTYVGTGLPFDLPFNAPIHWLWIRPLTGTIEGARWWSSMVQAHTRYDNGNGASAIPDVLIDASFVPTPAGDNPGDGQELRSLVRISGALRVNTVGVTYQYIAVSDAAMRFMLNGAFAHFTAAAAVENPLWHPRWTAQAAYFWHEVLGVGVAASLWYKGVGHASAAASQLNAAESALFAEFLLGSVRSQPTAHIVSADVAFNLWRRDDLSGDPGVPRVVQLVSYVGDNAASRVINLTPLSGRRPLFCLVTPHNATVALYRDPSHTTTTSSQINAVTNAATGIIAGGIDSITVGLALNATGITYDVFVLPGDIAGCNAGWSCNGVFTPVAPGVGGDPGGDVPPDFTDFEGDPPGGTVIDPTIDTDLGTDLDPACAPFTHKRVNRALGKLGITIQVTDLATELTAEATLARLHYTAEIAAVLRDFPWAFATKYVALTLVSGPAWATTALVQAWVATQSYAYGDVVRSGGTLYYCKLAHLNHVPPNATYWQTTAIDDATDDWTFAYRQPSDLVFARRLVREGMARTFDPDPPPFRIGQDLTGNLIYSDEAEAVLEYTRRPPCAGGAGDALFNDALEWRLAHAFAPGLAKATKVQEYCWQMYLHTLERAKGPNANEAQRQAPGDGDPDWIRGRN